MKQASPQIWGKLSLYEKKEWKRFYDHAFWELSELVKVEGFKNSRLPKECREIIAHNMACNHIWALPSKT